MHRDSSIYAYTCVMTNVTKRIYISLNVSLCWDVLKFYFLSTYTISNKLLLAVVAPSVGLNTEIHCHLLLLHPSVLVAFPVSETEHPT